MGFKTSKYMTGMKKSANFKTLSVAALTGVASLGLVNGASAADTTTITTPLPEGIEKTIELQTTYGEGNTSVTQDFTILGQEIPYTYKFDNLYGDENGDASVTTEATVLGQPVTFTYKYDSSTTSSRQTSFDGSDINSSFIGNYVTSSQYDLNGGAIYNLKGTIGDINSSFVGNRSNGHGGAIQNDHGKINSITGVFIGNYSTSYVGGAISNDPNTTSSYTDRTLTTIGNINANFIGNYVDTVYSRYAARGGAIHNEKATFEDITGNFLGNYVKTVGTGYGGAIYNHSGNNNSVIGNITGDFVGNYVEATNSASGGAIYNYYAKISSITGDFIGNYVQATNNVSGGAIHVNYYSHLGNITGDFIGNYAQGSSSASGGAIHNDRGTIGDITGDFIGNYAQGGSSASGGAIYNVTGTIGDITGDFIGNYASSSSAYGGAVYNTGIIGSKDENGNVVGGLINSSLIGNYAKSETGTAQGGAIYTNKNLNLIVDNAAVEIRDNYTESAGVKDDNAIYLGNASAKLTLNIKNNGSLLLKDNIDGVNGTLTDITGDGTGTLYLQNDIRIDVTMGNITLNTINDAVRVNNMKSLTLTGDVNMAVDVDLANAQMDRLTATAYGTHAGNLNVIGMNMLSDATADVTSILFAEQGLKDNVTYGGEELPHSNYQTTLYTPIYKYNASYDNREDAGYFVFTRGDKIPVADGGSSNPSNAFNPAVLGSSTSATVGATATMNQAFNYAFQHSADYMHIPYLERVSMKDRNKYALSITGDATDMGRFSPLYQPSDEGSSVWVKPYATFENVPLKNGPKVSNITYGTLVGFDSEMQSLKRGLDRVWTGYIGYNGASQR
ncbi:hypothetical protein IJ472_06200, partial [bacterium]|nr:hypothetical protein [bacterium]